MRFHRTEHITDASRVAALTALLDDDAPAFESYVHHGPERSPVSFDLYRSRVPGEKPVASYAYEGTALTCTFKAPVAPTTRRKS